MTYYKALVVEPSNVYQSIMLQLLEEHHCSALFAKTGKEALELIEHSNFDLICVALELSDMSGVELSQAIRKIEGYSQTVPLIIITSNSNKATFELALRAGATEIFHKNSLGKLTTFLNALPFNKGYNHSTGNILYVEDNPSQAFSVKAILSKQGHTLDHFIRAEDAIDAFDKKPYDLVLTDIVLDGPLTGLDIVKAIRSTKLSNTPILALSAINDTQQKLKLLQSGANDYVEKPVIQEELIVRAQNLIATNKLLNTFKKQQNYLHGLAMKDQLTGLFNRHFMMESGPKAIHQAQRHQWPLSMLVIDLDKFKSINDQYGHATGDTVLESIGPTLLNNVREEDIACRFGGEEFVVILPNCTFSQAANKAEQLRLIIEKSQPAGLTVTASIGVSSLFIHNNSDTFATLFSRADQGTYQAKANGRNQIALIDTNPDKPA